MASDSQLVAAARAGDQQAFGELVERHQPFAVAQAFSMGVGASDSQELAQEGFVLAWQKLDELRNPEHFRPWLCAIVRSLGVRAYRRQRIVARSQAMQGPPDLASDEPSPLERIIRREDELALRRRLRAMPEAYRLPLVLFYRQKKSVERVAKALGLSGDNVKQRLTRGRRMLQESLTVLEATAVKGLAGKGFTVAVMAAVAVAAPRPASAAGAESKAAPHVIRWWTRLAPAAVLMVAMGLFVRVRHPARPAASDAVVAPDRALARASLGAWPLGPMPFSNDLGRGGAERPARPVVLSLDFEDDNQPNPFRLGHVTSCPSAPGGGRCLIGTAFMGSTPDAAYAHPAIGHLEVKSAPYVFSYSPDHVLAFDYFLGGADPWMKVQIWDKEQGAWYIVFPTGLKVGFWAHLEISLASAKPLRPGAPALAAGDTIDDLYIFAGSRGDTPFYLDNLKIAGP